MIRSLEASLVSGIRSGICSLSDSLGMVRANYEAARNPRPRSLRLLNSPESGYAMRPGQSRSKSADSRPCPAR